MLWAFAVYAMYHHSTEPLIFENRQEAGRLLAAKLKKLKPKDALVLAIPRGGVVLGCEVARALDAELDIVTPRKLGAPFNPELAIGAIMPDGSAFLNEQVIALAAVPFYYIEEEKGRQMQESLRRLNAYRGNRKYPAIKGRTVVLVDDGIATGATMIAAARWVKKQGALRTIIAAPVIPPEAVFAFKKEADEVVYLTVPEFFYGIGQFYRDFGQVEDLEVINLLNNYWNKPDSHK